MYWSKYNIEIQVGDEVVLLNPLTGSIGIFTSSELNKIKNDPSIWFKYYGMFIFKDELEEDTLLQRLYEQWRKIMSKEPRQIFVVPTYACNLRCVYCFQTEDMRKSPYFSANMVKSLIDVIEKLNYEEGVERDPPEVVLFGGEPLLPSPKAMEAVEPMLKLFNDRGYRIKVITNGTTISTYAKILARYNVSVIQISVDGAKHVHDRRRIYPDGRGSFEDIVKGIDTALEYGLDIALRINVDAQNINSLPELARFIIDKGWMDTGHLIPYIAPVREICIGYKHLMPTHEILAKIFEMYKEVPETRILRLLGWRVVDAIRHLIKYKRFPAPQFQFCGANAVRYALDVYGDIYACITIVGFKEYSLGKWYPTVALDYEKLKLWRERSILSIDKCRKCKWGPLCGGGCSFLAIKHYNNLMSAYCGEFNIGEILRKTIEYYYDNIRRIVTELSQ